MVDDKATPSATNQTQIDGLRTKRWKITKAGAWGMTVAITSTQAFGSKMGVETIVELSDRSSALVQLLGVKSCWKKERIHRSK